MVKRMISRLSVLAVLIVFMAACSKKAEYIHVIPADASAVASINLNSLADKAGLGRLVAGAAVGDDGHPVGIGQILTDDQVAVHIQNVRIGQTQAHQLFVGDRLRRVHELLHFHTAFLQ